MLAAEKGLGQDAPLPGAGRGYHRRPSVAAGRGCGPASPVCRLTVGGERTARWPSTQNGSGSDSDSRRFARSPALGHLAVSQIHQGSGAGRRDHRACALAPQAPATGGDACGTHHRRRVRRYSGRRSRRSTQEPRGCCPEAGTPASLRICRTTPLSCPLPIGNSPHELVIASTYIVQGHERAA